MSEVKRLEMDHKGLPFVDDNGVYVLYEDYAELKAQRDALASENAALLDFDIDEFRDAGPYQPDDSILGKMKTPATAAYLNSVRAEGVERLLASLPPHYTARADIEQFAAQLRAGKDGE